MIVENLDSEVAEQPPLGVMPKKNLTEPVYQKIGCVRALNFNLNSLHRLDRCRVRNQVRHRPGGVLKNFRESRAKSFKPNVGCVVENSKARHDLLREQASGFFPLESKRGVRLRRLPSGFLS